MRMDLTGTYIRITLAKSSSRHCTFTISKMTVKLQQMIAEKGYERTLQEVSGLEPDDRVLASVMEELDN